MERYIGLVGIAVLIGCAYLLSVNRRRIEWRIVLVGLTCQFLIGFLLLRWPQGAQAINVLADKVIAFLNLSYKGSAFLFGNLVNKEMISTFGFQFAFSVLPMIIFFSAFMAMLYYLGVMQKVIEALAWIMQKIMRTSGAETLSNVANVFVGQTEAPLLIRPFLPTLTRSELLTIMVGGFATIAGSVLGAYVSLGASAQYLIIGSCMAAPGSLMIAKIIYPEDGEPLTRGHARVPDFDMGRNLLDAIAKGTSDGLRLALNVAAMLVAFLALLGFVDLVLGWLDRLIDGRLLGSPLVDGEYRAALWYGSVIPGSLKTFFGALLSPLAYLMGVPAVDTAKVGHLLGIKISANEFVAYVEMGKLVAAQALTPKAQIIATFALCGFANFSSIGIQIGGLSALSPERRADLAQLALRAMFGGAIVTCITGTIGGILL